MALYSITITEKNNKLNARTDLYNTDKIVDFYSRSATVTEFFYKEIEDGRSKTNKYTTTMSKAAFEAIFDLTTYETRLDLPITKIHTPTIYTVDRVQNIPVRSIQKCWYSTATQSWVEYDRSQFETIKVLATATLEEIAGAVSTSVSIAI